MASSNVRYWLALKAVPRLALAKKLTLAEKVGIKKLFTSPPSLSVFGLTEKQKSAICHPDWYAIDKIIYQAEQVGCQLISYSDACYPHQLKQIYDPPFVLFAKGDIAILNQLQIAIVGSRHATIHARESAQCFAGALSQNGLVVTSGLALGVDGYAHKGALMGAGKTIAVVATGLDQVYPRRHLELANQIIETGGLIISEFPPGTPPKPGHFPKRNRIISGMSFGVLVVEAAMKSGSLITARTALEQNREVFAIPGNIHSEQAKGCHWLIKQGAKLVDEVADILEELESQGLSGQLTKTVEKKFENNQPQDLSIDPLLASVGDETTPVDLVVSRSKLPIEEVVSRLTILELRGLVSAVPGGYQKLSRGN